MIRSVCAAMGAVFGFAGIPYLRVNGHLNARRARASLLSSARCFDGSDVDLLHRHYGLEGMLPSRLEKNNETAEGLPYCSLQTWRRPKAGIRSCSVVDRIAGR